jgi:hypothetical protein
MPNLWEKYKQLPSRTRLTFGTLFFTFSLVAPYVLDHLVPSEEVIVSTPEKILAAARK